ncbi:LacI family DNA-binding transcriptional regulator [Sphaerisporangium melleum]|uniref:LacI family transcriptional regulator n=1 Tax=Sphaerisporangium melleum TaxID=321316 RepID=A0A917RPK9_9ACTN|nr:LacI family DNA-binding transcriptional regulator [Sphaerisporangium melleum]GGL17627.1 LacI family transcriptional regulator [Sphaerisporangium melleum]
MTLQDVAREAGVSAATASRALNGSTRNVQSDNVSRVLAAAARLGYVPHVSAQATAKGSIPTVALVVSDVADPYFSSIAVGIIDAAEAGGLVVTMTVADRSPEREVQLVRTLRGQRPQIIIIAGSRINDTDTRGALIDELKQYRAAGGRVVLISQPELPFPTVAIDNVDGARLLARELAGAGYRRLCIIHAPHRIRTSYDRYTGFVTGLEESGISMDANFAMETEFTRSGGYEAARELVERGLRNIELIFAVNDAMALGVMSALRDAGLVPGRDVAVAGFDDISSAVDVVPALTTVTVPLRTAGLEAMRLALADDDAAGEAGIPTVWIPTAVRLRESTPPVSGRLITVR